MLTRDEICAVLDTYVEHLSAHDADRLVGLFADDAVLHEPLGARSYHGLAEIRPFHEANAKVPFSVVRHSPITVCGNHGAMQVRVQRDGMPEFLCTDLFELDDAGGIVALSVVLDPEAQA